MTEAWPLDAWPDVPTRVLVGREDRLFPADFQRRIARERLAIDADVIPGGHLIALSHPAELVERIEAYRIT
jgi:pimeloyl-ACP methyl ester carboxylesterase